jgi:hypothetical protein
MNNLDLNDRHILVTGGTGSLIKQFIDTTRHHCWLVMSISQ